MLCFALCSPMTGMTVQAVRVRLATAIMESSSSSLDTSPSSLSLSAWSRIEFNTRCKYYYEPFRLNSSQTCTQSSLCLTSAASWRLVLVSDTEGGEAASETRAKPVRLTWLTSQALASSCKILTVTRMVRIIKCRTCSILLFEERRKASFRRQSA